MNLLNRIRRFFKRKTTSADHPPRAVVLLLRDPVTLEQETLRIRIAAAWHHEIGVSNDDNAEKGRLVAAMPTSVIMLGNELYIVNCFDRPYSDHPQEFATNTQDLRQRKIVLESKAWMSVDLIRPEAPSADEMTVYYGKLCRLAAEFITENCLGVYLPETGGLRANDSELKSCLQAPHPLAALDDSPYAPVVNPPNEDALQSAVAEARRRWPEFVAAFGCRTMDQPFAVKAPFTEDAHCEWMWIAVDSLNGDVVEGILGNAPLNLRNLREGDRVTVQAQDIGDWIYQEGEQTTGGFSIPVLQKK